MTRVLTIAACALFLSGTAIGAAETWSNVPLVDTMCATKVKDAPDAHTKACALKCAKGGFGIIAADGTFLALDAEGNRKALEALNSSTKADHLRVTVTGDRTGQTVAVASIRLQ